MLRRAGDKTMKEHTKNEYICREAKVGPIIMYLGQERHNREVQESKTEVV